MNKVLTNINRFFLHFADAILIRNLLCCGMTAVFIIFLNSCSSTPKINHFDQHFQQGEDYFSQFEYDKALFHFEEAARLQPGNSEVYYRIGLIYGALHSQNVDEAIIGGRRNRLSRIQRRADSNYNLAVDNFQKAADLGHSGAREILRTMYDNIQHQDVKY